MNSDYEIFANNLKYYMNKYGYNQSTLAEKLGVSNTSVFYWISGDKFPRMSKVVAMCELFNCTKADLLQIDQRKLPTNASEQMERLIIYAQHLNAKGVDKVIDFISDLKDDYFQESN